MKRHESLAPLSRHHHRGLMLAQLLRKGAPVYRNMPETTEEKISYAVRFFKNELKEHFEKEAAVFDLVKPVSTELENLANDLIIEHEKLECLFYSLTEDRTGAVETMNEIGELLSSHIRKEERVFFPLIQENCPEDKLQQISLLLDEQLN